MSTDDFLFRLEILIQEERKKYLRKISPELRKVFRDIPIRVLPSDEKNELYADYHGTAYADERAFAPYSHPSDITFYVRGFRDFAHDEKKLRDMIRMVLVHEYGHYLGFSENDLRKRGL